MAVSNYSWFFGFWFSFCALLFLESRLSEDGADLRRRTRWPINIGFGVINAAVAALLPIGTVLAAQWAATNEIGLFHELEAPAWLVVGASVLIRSLSQYAFHRLAHRVPALWAVHRVHHSDTKIDASTGLRFHPFELIANLAFVAAFTVALGLDPATLAIFESVEIVIGIASHAGIALPVAAERSLRTVFITPGLHRLHHSDFSAEAETNFGSVFSFWDRLFRTYRAEKTRGADTFRFGVTGIDNAQAMDFDWLFLSPWRANR